jgi:hypothetical protein
MAIFRSASLTFTNLIFLVVNNVRVEIFKIVELIM